jgi:hypothetical protein
VAREDYAAAAAMKQELVALGPADAAEQDGGAPASGEERPGGKSGKGGGGKLVRGVSHARCPAITPTKPQP